MKTMKKLWVSICSFTFALALGLGVVATVNSQPIQAEAANTLGSFNVGLNMSMSELANNGVVSQYNSSFLYLAIENGEAIHYSDDWSVAYTSVGDAVKVNGVAKPTKIIKTQQNAAALALLDGGINLGVGNVGDTLTIDGEFTHETYGTFTLKEATFIFDGYTWMEEDTVTYAFELSTRQDATPQRGFYASMAANDIPVGTESDGWQYWTDACADNQYILTSDGVSTAFKGNLCKYGASDWYIGFANEATGIYDSGNGTPKNGDIITLGGWFGCYGGTLGYIKIANAQYEYKDGVWTNITPSITVKLGETVVENDAISVAPGSSTTAITATCEKGNVATVYEVNAVEDGKFVLRNGENASTYRAMYSYAQTLGSRTVYFTKEMAIRVGFEDFVMEEGAAVRVVNDNVNGLRFTAEMMEMTYNNLIAQDATFGMVIVPRDYITAGYELTAENLFGVNAKYVAGDIDSVPTGKKLMLHLSDLIPQDYDKDGKYEIRGAITDILTNNLTREFVPAAYAKIGDKYILADYFADDVENNARSIYYVAQKAVDAGDNASKVQTKYIDAFNNYVSTSGKTYNRSYTVNYIKTVNGKSTVDTEVFTAPLNSAIELTAKDYSGFVLSSAKTINSKIYANKENVFNFYYAVEGAPVYDSVAWYHPPLDASNNYDNATNDAIAKAMKDAGFTTVILAGPGQIVLDSEVNIENTRLVIDMFYRNGLKSIVCAPNWTDNENYQLFDYLPDFSNHEGFAGFHIWDEPYPRTEDFERILQYVEWYKNAYEDVEGVEPFIINLNPSYAPFFNGDESINPDYTNYVDYVQEYCDIVLSEFDGTNYPKFLSVDTYPIKRDGTLRENFLYDMAVLKALAMNNDAHTHIALQACGWDNEPDDGERADCDTAPTEEQMRLQLYTALAFGADSISWWAYTPIDIIVDAPLDKNGNTTDVYTSIQNVNNELATFGSLYKNYTWNGVIMNNPSSGFFGIGADAQYKAYKKVKDEDVFADYLLSVEDIPAFTSIDGSGSNHIIGVLEDDGGHGAYVAVNYSAVKDNKTLELTFKGRLGQYAIYKDGKMEMVTIDKNGYTLKLAPGEGAFIVEANSEHTVTFKNWDGTVLQEETLMFGSIPEYTGATPTKQGYNFTGWTPAIGAISGDTVYTALFEECGTVYEGGSVGTVGLATPIPMSDLVGKAIHFEFKFETDGQFGFAIMAGSWANAMGTIRISKQGGVITAENWCNTTYTDAFRIVEVGGGWYAFEMNHADFIGDGLANADNIGLIYEQGETITGKVRIDWNSFKVVDAFETYGRPHTVYEGGSVGTLGLPNPIPMSDLVGRAIHFEFKFETDGQFGFAVMAGSWANAMGTIRVTKSGDSVTAQNWCNTTYTDAFRIVEVGGGWYAFEMNHADFIGDGLANADNIGLIYEQGEAITGKVRIDWNSFKAVDAFETRGMVYEGGSVGTVGLATPIPMSNLVGKAIHFEFKFETDGQFGFAIMAGSWANAMGTIRVTKAGDNITCNVYCNNISSTKARIVEVGGGWYAFEMNHADFIGDGLANAENIGLIYEQGEAITGKVRIDWNSFKAVNAFETRGTVYQNGENIGTKFLPNPIPMSDLVGKALHFEFKFEDENGFFGMMFADSARDWANLVGTLQIRKTNGNITANFGSIIEVGGGWYAWELNRTAFGGDGADRAVNFDMAYFADQIIEGTLRIDWNSFKVVDDIRDRSNASTYVAGTKDINQAFTNGAIPRKDLLGKAFSIDFKFETDGSFGVTLQSWSWKNMTGEVIITKSGNSITASQGIIVARTDGWYSWQLNESLFYGDGANQKAASEVAFIYWGGTVSGTVQIDGASVRIVDAYAYDRTAFATKYTDGQNVGQYWLGASAIQKAEWDNQWAGFKLRFEFKFETDGGFGFTAMASDWANVTGTIIIAKSGDSVTANMGSIIDLGDGWYAFEINAADFAGDGASRATGIDFVYYENITIEGTVWINWHFRAIATA